MSDDSKPVETVEAPKLVAPEVAHNTIKIEGNEGIAVPKEEASVTAAEKKDEVKSEETAEVKKDESAEKKDDVKSEETAEGKKDESAEKNGESKSERKSRSRSPYSKRRRDDRSRSPRNDRRTNDRRGRGRDNHHNGGDRPFRSHKENIKSQYELAESSDPDEIRKQVEFYFSDSNLARDKFLWTQTGGPDNKAVPISVIHSFKRMRHFQPFSAVVAALKESTFLEVVDNDEVKRKTALPVGKDVKFEDTAKLFESESMNRSIYVKGFGEEEIRTQLDIEDFFEPFGPVKMVKLRRNLDQEFKGSVFVEFESEEVMKDFMDLDIKPQWKGADLKFQTKKAYCATKVDDINAGKIRPSERDDRGSFRGRAGNREHGDRGRGRGRGRGGRGNNDRRDRDRGDRGGDDRDWKTRRDNDQRKDRGGDRRRRSPSPPKMQFDERGVPVVHTSPPPSASKPANGVTKEASQSNDKKRAREDDAAGETSEAKKVKADV